MSYLPGGLVKFLCCLWYLIGWRRNSIPISRAYYFSSFYLSVSLCRNCDLYLLPFYFYPSSKIISF